MKRHNKYVGIAKDGEAGKGVKSGGGGDTAIAEGECKIRSKGM